jgi:hypothetical protein
VADVVERNRMRIPLTEESQPTRPIGERVGRVALPIRMCMISARFAQIVADPDMFATLYNYFGLRA